MVVRIRKDGRVLCAAIHPQRQGDTYIDDSLHYHLSVEQKVLVTEPASRHKQHGQWWWRGNIPKDVKVARFYEVSL